MSVARTASRFAKNTDTNNNEEGVNGFNAADRQVSAAERAARRAKRAERMNVRVDNPSDSTNSVTSSISSMKINVTHNEEKPGSVGGIKTTPQRSSASFGAPKCGSTVSNNKFQFGIDYSKKAPPAQPSRPFSGRSNVAVNKYTPTVKTNSYSSSNRNSTGRFQGIQKDEPEAPSFGGSAADRMAHFRASMEKEKAQKAKEEERKMQSAQKAEEEKKKQEEEKKKADEQKKEEEEKKAAEEQKSAEDIPDSEKMKHLPACKKKREKKPARRTMSISNIVLDWVQEMTKDYPVEITNFSTSWNNGMAFCALIHKFNPDEFDFNELDPENKRHNFDLAFTTGEKVKNIPILLDTNDMVRMKKPEPRSVQTYIQWIWSVYGPTSGYGPTPQEVQQATLN